MNGNGCLTYAFITEANVSSELTNIPIQHNQPPYFFFFPLLVIGSPKQKPSKDRAAVERHFQRTDITHLLRHRVRGSVDVAFFFEAHIFASHSFTHGSSSLFRFVLIFFDWCIHESFDAPELTLMLIYYLEFR